MGIKKQNDTKVAQAYNLMYLFIYLALQVK